MNYYVTYTTDLLRLDKAVGVPSGKKRIAEDGEVEAELICLDRKSNRERIWIRKENLIP